MLKDLLRWLEVPINLMLWASLAAGTLMMLHVSADVTGRTVFNHPLPGTTEIVAAYYMVVAAFLPWGWIARNDLHIRADLFLRVGSKGFQFWLEIAVKMLTAVYVSVFTYQTCIRALQQTRAGEVWEAGGTFILVWPSRWLLPLAGALMLIYLVLRVADDVLRTRPR